MEELYNSLDEVIKCIKESPEYIKCNELKGKMKSNSEINELIEKVKKLQKQYIKTNDNSIKDELDGCINRLNEIPIYYTYNENLKLVNEKIEYVKDSLNNYFYKLFNEE